MTHGLPELLLSYGVKLIKHGNSYMCQCISRDHNDSTPSMSVYINGTGKYTTHCHGCGFHEDAIGVVAYFEGISQHEAGVMLDDPKFTGAGRYTTVVDKVAADKRPERITFKPPPDAPEPKMGWLTTKDGEPFGDPVAVYAYNNDQGEVIFYEARYMVNGKKEPRCFSWGNRGEQPAKWECGFFNRPRPIYGLDNLANRDKSAQVVIFEGPRKADAGQQILPMPCVGWAGGSNGWKYSQWDVIAGRKVILWPDADKPGRDCMTELAQHLTKQGCECRILKTEDMPDGWDICDSEFDKTQALTWAREHKGDIVELAQEPPKVDPRPEPPPEVDSSKLGFSKPFNVFSEIAAPLFQHHQMPKVISDWAFHMDGIVGADRSVLAMCALVTCAGAIHDGIKLQPEQHNKGWSESARLWGAIVGGASIKKSPSLDRAKAELEEIEKELVEQNLRAKAEYKTALKIYDKMETDYVAKVAKGDKSAVMPTPPEMGELPRVYINVATVEALEGVLKNSTRGLIANKDELVEFFGSLDAYKSKGGSDRGAWLSMYNGGGRHVDKVSAGSYYIKNWSSSMIGCIQPDPMRKICAGMNEDGLLQRFMIISGRNGREGNQQPENRQIIESYNGLMRQLYNTMPSSDRVTLTEEANTIRREITGKAFELISLGYVSPSLCSHLGKWEGLSARLMLTFHCIDCAINRVHPQSVQVSAETAQMVKAFMLEFLLPHATAFYIDIVGNNAYGQHIRTIANYLLVHQGATVTNANITANCSSLRALSDQQYQTVVRRLVDYGWLLPDMTKRVFKDFPSTWHVNPELQDMHNKQRQDEAKRRAYERETIDANKAMYD